MLKNNSCYRGVFKFCMVRLVSKFGSYGNQGELPNQIQRWLGGRSERIVVAICFSGLRPVTNGVPQGLCCVHCHPNGECI